MDLCNYLSESLLDDEGDVTATSEKHMIIEDVYKQFVDLRIIKQDKFPKEWFDVDNRGRLIISPTKEVELNFSYWGWMIDYVKEHGLLFGKKTDIIINQYSGKVSDLNIIDLKGGDMLFKYSNIKLDKLPNNVKNLTFEFSSIQDLMTPLKKLNVKSICIDNDSMESIAGLWVKKITGKLPDIDTGYGRATFQL